MMDTIGDDSTDEPSSQSDDASQSAITIPIPIHRTLIHEDISLGMNSVPNIVIQRSPPLSLSQSLPLMITSVSSTSVKPIQDDMEFYRNLCSICFDRCCEFSLPKCQDQFCRECMRHFLEETIRNKAWGFATLDIKCPVCYDLLTKDVWTRYADTNILSLYEEYSAPSRVLTRFCGRCGSGLRVCGDIAPTLDMKKK
jgi:hypothetical protein